MRKITITLSLDPKVLEDLKILSKKSGMPVNEAIRRAINIMLYEKKGQTK
jgi:hypothetical protein